MNKPKLFLLITLSLPLIFAGSCPTPEPGPPDAGLYHTYAEIQQELQDLQNSFPSIAKVFDLGKSIQKRSIWAIKISDNVAQQEEDEPEVLFIGGHHAREWISIDVPFLLAKHLLENYSADEAIRNYIDNGQIWIIPLLNPDGHQYSVTTNRLWRKNRRNNGDGSFGVDLNRNYAFQWGGPGSSGDTESEIYRGPSPFSEPESQVIRDFANQHNFLAMISYHNFSQLVLYPWGHTNAPAPDQALLNTLAQTMADSILKVHGRRYVAQQSSDLYLASGDATDWLYGETSVPSYTIELRPTSSFPGFQLPESEIQPTFEENVPAALFLIDWSQKGGSISTMK
ncbi:MAG: M14 family metallopeptidase [bacterium]